MYNKIYLFFIIAVLTSSFCDLSAQTAVPFKVKFETIPASCYNNGMVLYTLINEDGSEMTEEQYSTYVAQGIFDKVSIYHKVTINDEKQKSGIYYNGGWDTLLINFGTYFIGVEGTYNDPNNPSFNWVEVDTMTQLTVESNYIVPEASAIYTTAYTDDGFGKHPTLACEDIGRIQLKIEYGSFPYSIWVVRHGTTDTLRHVVITEPQYDGEDEWLYNYKNYYTFDNMPAGDWDFYLVDGCGYGLPHTGQTVDIVDLPYLQDVEVYASSGNMNDSSVVKINAVLDYPPYGYYIRMLSSYMEYCFTFNGETSSWKAFPEGNQQKVLLFDTIIGAHKYCDFLDQDITLNYRINYKSCAPQEISKTIQLHKPNESHFLTDSQTVTDSVTTVENCSFTTHMHLDAYSIKYRDFQPNHTNTGGDHSWIRYHFTHPLTWIYSDAVTGVEIKREEVEKINSASNIYASEVQNFYNIDWPIQKSITRTLVDAHGCVLYNHSEILNFDTVKISDEPSWDIRYTLGDHCCNETREIDIFSSNSGAGNLSSDPDGTTISLIQSPHNNRYNFDAKYDAATRSWKIKRFNLANTAFIDASDDGRRLMIEDYCLPSGPYYFRISTSCGDYVIERNIDFPDYYTTEVVEEPQFVANQQCTDLYITYNRGQIARVAKDTDPSTGLPRPDIYTPLTTYFQFIDGPIGGFDNQIYKIDDQIRISIPGTYILRFFPEASDELCEIIEHYDTLVYNGATVQFEYAYALLCDINDNVGNAYIKAFDGTLPYTFTLYSGPGLTGNIIAVNDNGIFKNVPMSASQEMSCLITDNCGAFFSINFYPQATAELQKTWFENGLKASITCEGSVIQVHALKIGNIFDYEWTGPNGFYSISSDPYVFIERNSPSGYYKVKISQDDCQETLYDSIYLSVKPAPLVEISPDTMICPGQKVELTFVPKSKFAPLPVEFDIYFENSEGIEVRHYGPVESGSIVKDIFRTISDAKIYPKLVVDDSCDYGYAHPEDTTYIKVKTNTLDMCSIETINDLGCYGYNATLSAHSTMDPPYVISWYSDFELTQLLKSENITSYEQWSKYDTNDIVGKTVLFVSIANEDECPAVNGIVTSEQNFTDGETTLSCGETYRLYDSGGKNGNYETGYDFTYHTYSTSDGQPLVMTFEYLELSETSHLYILNGSELVSDSIIYDLTYGSSIPDLIVSESNTITLFFVPGVESAAGWSAILNHAPTIAIADVYARNHTTFYDVVCESKILPYEDVNHFINPGDTEMQDRLNKARQTAGSHLIDKIEISDVTGCDSIVSLVLFVTPPPVSQETVVTTTLINGGNYEWHGKTYNTSGQHADTLTVSGGCDSIAILNLIILEIDTSKNDVCIGDSSVLGVHVVTPELSRSKGNVLYRRSPGDVLCTDGTVLSPDSFLLSGKKPMGVVFYVDKNDINGLAIALTDAFDGKICWAREAVQNHVHADHFTNYNGNIIYGYDRSYPWETILDMDGMLNTLKIMMSALNATDQNFRINAPAAYYCYYYDHNNHVIPSTNDPLINEEPLGWYLPAAGELNIFNANRTYVNKTLSLLKANGFNAEIPTPYVNINDDNSHTGSGYWTSTEGYHRGQPVSTVAFWMQAKGQLNGNKSKSVSINGIEKISVRAVRAF